jgi:hypothetical protein
MRVARTLMPGVVTVRNTVAIQMAAETVLILEGALIATRVNNKVQ